MGIKESGPLTTYKQTMKPMRIAEVLVEWRCIFGCIYTTYTLCRRARTVR